MMTIKKEKTKKEQLTKVFNTLLRRFAVAISMHYEGMSGYHNKSEIISGYTNEFVKEVSIRTPLK